MAGAGYKLFQTGDVLTAAQVNTYLNEQTVMVFANAAARTSALTSVLAEGMVSYLQDTNAVEVYNGSAWVGVSGAGDVTEVQAGTGISVASGTGPIPVVTNTMATAVDAKGDLIVGTGADTFAKLTVGTNGYTLVADSAETTGLKWQAASSYNPSYSLIGSVSLSGAASRTVSGISGKTDLFILVVGASTSGATDSLKVTINADTGSNYYYNGSYANNTGSSLSWTTWSTSGDSYVWFGSQATAASTINGFFRIQGCNSAGLKMFDFNASPTAGTATERWLAGGYWNNTATVSSFKIESNANNFDAGTMYVYGA